MSILNPQSVEDYIISLLQKNSSTGALLLEAIQKNRAGTTKQALYAALRKLRTDEIVVTHKKRISLSSVWVTKMEEFFQLAQHFYTKSTATDDGFLNLEDGDRISYTFKNPTTTDIFWGHTSLMLRSIMPAGEPMYMYMPHDWFMLAREDSERLLLKQSEDDGHPWYRYVPSKTPLDEHTKALFHRPSFMHTENKKYFKDNYYINTHGDYLIEVVLDPKTQTLIDDFYKNYSVWNKDAKLRLQNIVSNMKGKNKLTISRNKKRADAFKKMMGKYFYIKPSNSTS